MEPYASKPSAPSHRNPASVSSLLASLNRSNSVSGAKTFGSSDATYPRGIARCQSGIPSRWRASRPSGAALSPRHPRDPGRDRQRRAHRALVPLPPRQLLELIAREFIKVEHEAHDGGGRLVLLVLVEPPRHAVLERRRVPRRGLFGT